MAAQRRGLSPMNVNLKHTSTSLSNDTPPIAALFLIRFDIKAGYTISWKRSLPNVELDGVVEYKSLPSGLHTVAKDFIYFVHGEYAGLSAFISTPASEAQRNAVMLAVGVLVPLSFGRLGRSWKHADQLATIAWQLAYNKDDLKPLEEYWASHQLEGENVLDSITVKDRRHKKNHKRSRSASDGTPLLLKDSSLPRHHPALKLTQLLKTFGPLIFPIYRAAILRRRILLSCHAPVQETCDFVYNISVLSNIPLSIEDIIISSAPPQRLRPLFTIGVHDIPLLEEDHRLSKLTAPQSDRAYDVEDPLGHGWIACTTDGILGQKSALYDVLVTMPTTSRPSWPTVQMSSNTPVKATQRDLRRYRALNWSLSRLPKAHSPTSTDAHPGLSRRPSSNNFLTTNDATISIEDTDPIVEPQSWSALAYSGFMWWASAGAPEISLNDEFSSDAALLDDLMPQPLPSSNHEASTSSSSLGVKEDITLETGLIAYFHRLTTNIFETIAGVIEDSNDSDNDAVHPRDENSDDPFIDTSSESQNQITNEPSIYITTEDITDMGLDSWSVADHEFIIEICKVYFGRSAVIEGRNLDVCGVRIC